MIPCPTDMSADPKTRFSTAEVFRAGSGILSRHMPALMFPMVMCASFSLELYLKSLVLLESGEAERGHNLETLFSKVSPESQRAIRENYEKKRTEQNAMFAASKVPPLPKTDFDFILHASAEAFENFRYAYEGIVKDQTGWLAGPIGECVRERIMALHPEWANSIP